MTYAGQVKRIEGCHLLFYTCPELNPIRLPEQTIWAFLCLTFFISPPLFYHCLLALLLWTAA